MNACYLWSCRAVRRMGFEGYRGRTPCGYGTRGTTGPPRASVWAVLASETYIKCVSSTLPRPVRDWLGRTTLAHVEDHGRNANAAASRHGRLVMADDVGRVLPEGTGTPLTIPGPIFAAAVDTFVTGQRLDMRSLARRSLR